MEKQYMRVLSIRRHKTITFINVYNDLLGNIQCMIDNDLIININCGDLIKCNISDDFNRKGERIKRIISVDKVISSCDFQSYKGIHNGSISDSEKRYLNARNCGSQLTVLKYKKDILKNIRGRLDSLDFFDASGLLNTVEYYSNGSNIKEAVIRERADHEPKYLRVTLENQLKQMTAVILKSTYAIEKVFRNMGEDKSHINEFLMLELVSIEEDISQMIDFVKYLDKLSKEQAESYNIDISHKDLQIIDYNEIPTNQFERFRKSFINTLVTNFPCESPFILKDEEGMRKEIRWYINGHWISHFYQDENNYNNVKEILLSQQKLKDNLNPISYIEWGLPSTVSFGLSIDRWLQMLLDINNINSVANPIALDYPKTRRLK